jgi:UDP-2,4-diacetamido-2,4,6-trideoxy-beta-L-altropyranose hydrolase
MSGTPAIVIRADASQEIGTGHVVRTLTLGRELIARGWRLTLATRRLPDALRALAGSAGIAVHDVPDDVLIAVEPGYLAQHLPATDVVLTDNYQIAGPWHQLAREWVAWVAAIDDLAVAPQHVDLLLNQNLGASPERYAALVPEGCRLLLGPGFALVDPAFARARLARAPRDGTIRRLFVFMSGADPANTTQVAASAAASLGRPVDVVVGAAYPHQAALLAWALTVPHVTIHVNTPRVAELMAAADLAIGAPSSASWERCTVGLPAILLTLADNQVEVGQRLDRSGAAISLGWHHDVGAAQLNVVLRELDADPARLVRMGEVAAAMTDGEGVGRVADALTDLVGMTQTTDRYGGTL